LLGPSVGASGESLTGWTVADFRGHQPSGIQQYNNALIAFDLVLPRR